MKRIVALLCCAALLMAVTGCNQGEKGTNTPAPSVSPSAIVSPEIPALPSLTPESPGPTAPPTPEPTKGNVVSDPRFRMQLTIPDDWEVTGDYGDEYDFRNGLRISCPEDDISILVYEEYTPLIWGMSDFIYNMEYDYQKVEELPADEDARIYSYIMESDEEILFMRYNVMVGVFLQINYGSNRKWFSQNKSLIMEIGESLMYTESYTQQLKQEEELYNDFIESRAWATYTDLNNEEYTDDDLVLQWVEFFDFDVDGYNELYITAHVPDSPMPCGVSWFCTIEDGEVSPLLFGRLSGGTIGGDQIIVRWDMETDRHVVGLAGFASGFGGYAEWKEYYDYAGREMDFITSFEEITMNDSGLTEYYIDGEEATKAEYDKVAKRFVETENLYYTQSMGM